jgi:ankyrin repeat protein
MAAYTTVIDRGFRRLKRMRDNQVSEEIMDFLEKAHSDLKCSGISNTSGPFKRSLIHYAAMGDCKELLLQLLAIRTPINYRDGDKRTSLSWATQYGSYVTARILVENGANVNALDKMYLTPLSRLLQSDKVGTNDHQALKLFLEKNGATRKGTKRAWIMRRIGLL